MKKLLSTYILAILGAVMGNILYVHTAGDPADYHWTRTLFFGALAGTALLVFRRHQKNRNLP